MYVSDDSYQHQIREQEEVKVEIVEQTNALTHDMTIDARSQTMIDIEDQVEAIQDEDKHNERAAMKYEPIEAILRRFNITKLL